jgi:hypothetical protein
MLSVLADVEAAVRLIKTVKINIAPTASIRRVIFE